MTSDRDRSVDVLLVEDNPGDVRLTREALGDGSVDVTLHVAEDGEAAIDCLRSEEAFDDAARPDVVLLDLNLPRKDGFDVLAELRDDDLRDIPVVVLTSSDAREDVCRCYERGANAYITKPTDPDAFIEALRSFERFWLSAAVLPDAG